MEQLQSIRRAEHPRPDYQRETFFNLNGTWQFAFDDQNLGLKQGWAAKGHELNSRITVPFCYQCTASGIGDKHIHPILWYRRSFHVPAEMQGKRLLLRFGAVDFSCQVYLNGQQVGQHRGGYTPFALDVTAALCEGANDLCLRVQDAPDCAQPRGKQYWNEGLMGCWYTPISGIWQTVYLEAVGEYAFEQIHITPDIDQGTATFELALDQIPAGPLTVEIDISFEGVLYQQSSARLCAKRAQLPISLIVQPGLDTLHLWAPQHPSLYDAEVRLLQNGCVVDCVRTYFGMRKIELVNGLVLLNHSPLYQRLILDQGYWPDTLLTPPSDEAIREDVELTLQLGYNGARKHQKVEDPRYYYWADKLGLLVWGEVPSAYEFCNEMIANLASTLQEFIQRDFNHPSIICWTTMNESWGVRSIYHHKGQQETARMLYHLVKAVDGTRLVSGNDGWEQVETDICALHDYTADKDIMRMHFANRAQVEASSCDFHMCWADTCARRGDEAFMITEYGGIAYANNGQHEADGMETWGYHDKVTNEEAFFQRFEAVNEEVLALPHCQGYCYTQLTDVMQEINGLLTPDRKPKMDINRFAKANHNPLGRSNES